MFSGERLLRAGGVGSVRYRLPWLALEGHKWVPQRSIALLPSASELLERIGGLVAPLR